MTSVRDQERRAQMSSASKRLTLDRLTLDVDCYFFFSTCSVCLRSRGLNLLSFSFSPPVLRRIV